LPFAILGSISGSVAWYMKTKKPMAHEAEVMDKGALAAQQAEAAEEAVNSVLQMDGIRVGLGYGLLPPVNSEDDSMFTQQIKGLRRLLANEMGFVMPTVRIQDNMQLPQNTYIVRIKEIESARGDARPAMLLVMVPRGDQITLPGDMTTEPMFGLPAM
jgi:flagellar biosynthesis protein FlhA